jgi:MipA family protein
MRVAATMLFAGSINFTVQAAQSKLPLWEAGVLGFHIHQLAYPGSDQQIGRSFVLPYFIYRGELLRAERDNVGLRAFKTDTLELDIGFAAALGSSDDDLKVRQGMADLGSLIEAGPRLRWKLHQYDNGTSIRADFPLRAVLDLSDSLNYSGISFEPTLFAEHISADNSFYRVSVSALIGNETLTDYFYQVKADEVMANRPQFDAKGGLMTLRSSVSVAKRWSSKWRSFGFARYEWLQGAVNANSPLVVKQGGWSFGVGLTYIWAVSDVTVSP